VRLARAAAAGVACLAFVLASGTVRADDDIAALRGRLDQIKELVAEFETRLSALEAARSSASAAPSPQAGATTAIAATAPVAAPVVVPRTQWRRVEAGLTMDEVSALIGAPTKTFDLAGKRVWYYYYPGVGAGSVFFDAHGRASSFQRPAGAN
jgi:hypothetical protein